MTNELTATQGQPEGEAAAIPGNEAAPELNNDEQHHDAGQGENTEGGEGEGTGEEATAGSGEQQQQEEAPKPQQKKPLSWEMKRIHEETNKRREAEQRARDLEAELARARGGTQQPDPPADGAPPSIDEIRRQEREAIRREESVNAEIARRNAACNSVFEKGVTEIPDFDDARISLVSAFGHEINTKPEFLDAITELDNGHQVFAELGRNPAEAERILGLSPVKMALEIARMGDRLAKPATPAPKPISKVPPPVSPVGGQPKTTVALDDPDADQSTWSADFHKMMAEKLKGRR